MVQLFCVELFFYQPGRKGGGGGVLYVYWLYLINLFLMPYSAMYPHRFFEALSKH